MHNYLNNGQNILTTSTNHTHRTGKRSRMGLMKDGYNSMIRYYYNNFSDGFRQVSQLVNTPLPSLTVTQDAIDLFLGNYVVDQWHELTGPSPLQLKRSWLARMVS